MGSMDIVGSKLVGDEILPFLVEVRLKESTSDSFLKIRESLTRIGVAARRNDDPQMLFQTCHILSKRGKYYICHFKSLFVLDGRENNLSHGDIARQNLIIKLLQDWGMVTVVNQDMIKEVSSMSNVKIVKYEDRAQWILTPKYDVGGRARRQTEG